MSKRPAGIYITIAAISHNMVHSILGDDKVIERSYKQPY